MTAETPEIHVELFGVPQLVTGQRSVVVCGRTLSEVAAALGRAYPPLLGTVIHPEHGWLLGGYTFVVDECFTREPSCELSERSSVLLVTSVAGG